MGLGQLIYKQWVKGFMFLFIQAAFIVYFVLTGATDLFGFFTLGMREGNAWYGIEGDNSVVMLIMGILAILILILYIAVYISNVKDVYRTQCAVDCLKNRWRSKAKYPRFWINLSIKLRWRCPL